MYKKSKLGYSDKSPFKDEPFINIKSNTITMKNTSKDLIGLGIKDGKIVKVLPMKAGETKNYDFGDVDSVLEIPKFQNGAKAGYDYYNDPDQILRGQQQGQQQATQLSSVQHVGATPGGLESVYGEDATQQNESFELQQMQGFISQVEKENAARMNKDIVDTEGALNKTLEVKNNEMFNTYQRDTNPYQNQNPQQDNTINPYGGVDLNTAASLFGRSIKDGDVGMGIMSGAKLGLGLTRNFMSGYASQNRNEYVEDWNEQKNQEHRNGTYQAFQDGGALTREDIQAIKNNLSINFDDSTVNNLFERTPRQQGLKPPAEVNLGRYKDVNYFNVLQNKDGKVILTNTQNNPHNIHTVDPVLAELQKLNPDREIGFEYTRFEDGGMAKKLTGEYVDGLANQNPQRAVAEVEAGEYMQSPDGNVSEVIGQTHEQGGEKMTAEQLEPGTKIVSDNLKLGASNAKYFKDKYNIKVKATDTYATVLDKASQKIGLKKIVDEQEEIIKSLEKNQNTGSETTRKLNQQFLSEKLNELEQKKAPLEEARKQIMDEVFQKQEESKPKEGQPTQKFQDGGSPDPEFIKNLASQYNLPYDKALEVINEYIKTNGTLPIYDQNGETSVTANSQPFDIGEAIVQDINLKSYIEPAGITQSGPELITKEDIRTGLPVQPKDTAVTGELSKKDKGNRANIAMFPDQSILPPNSMSAHAKDTVNLSRMEGFKVSPEQQLSELGSSLTTGINAASQLPDSQRQAVIAQLLAGAQGAQNQAISTSNIANLQSQTQTGNLNRQISDQERAANIQQNQRFEQLQMRAKETTDMDYRDWQDYNRRLAIMNYQQANQQKLLNQLFENYGVDGAGNVYQKKDDEFFAKRIPSKTSKTTNK